VRDESSGPPAGLLGQVGRESLGALRRRVSAETSGESLERLAEALAVDSRAGARALAETARRRREKLRREHHRQQQLFARERQLRNAGAQHVAGVDEVGMGPLAGPVVAGAVVLPERVDLAGLDDSKRLTPQNRTRLGMAIREQAIAVGIGFVSSQELDRINVYRAGLLAMERAVADLSVMPDHVLVDARTIPGLDVPQTAIVGGDRLEGSIAAASIVAKVYRDEWMTRLAERYPGYGFERHKGYGTREHLAALERLGPTPDHRRSFAPVGGSAPA